ncbi:MAG: SDR family NAD(P)-dependent oxidoreductase [Bacillota bacterium]
MNNDIFGLKGKISVIIGASKGIGKESARLLSASGAKVVIVSTSMERLEKTAAEIEADTGGQILPITADATKEEDVVELFDQIESEWGIPDILVNVVGGGKPTEFLDISAEEWDGIFDYNVKSCFLSARECIQRMDKGKIINVSSIAGQRCSLLQGAHYSASKAAVIGLTRHLAREFGPRGITVNCLAPGVTLTKRITKQMSKEREEELISSLPIGRLSTAEDQAKVILFMASDLAAYLTGETISTSGGALLG